MDLIDLQSSLFPPLQSIVNEYVDPDLIEFALDIFEVLPLNKKAIILNQDYYINDFHDLIFDLSERYSNSGASVYSYIHELTREAFLIFVEIDENDIGSAYNTLVEYLMNLTKSIIIKFLLKYKYINKPDQEFLND